MPPAGTEVRLLRGDLAGEGVIAWCENGQSGIEFTGNIEIGAWLKGIGHRGQRRVDGAVSALRTRQAPPRGIRAEPPLSVRQISQELGRLCDRVAGSATMSVELGEELLRLEALAWALEQAALRK